MRIVRYVNALIGAAAMALGMVGGVAGAATSGWSGESIVSTPATGDGWEPAIAADPAAPFVYTMYMQYSGTKVVDTIRVSSDGGASWGAPKPICPSCSGGMYDPVLAVTTSGVVDAVFMQQNNIDFEQSTNHGATWSAPLTISGGTWADKPWFAVSGGGQDIYVSWSTRGNLYEVTSHNSGQSFTTPQQVTSESGIYYYSNGGTVLANGTALLVGSEYPEKGNNTKITGPVKIVVFRSTNGGTSWTRTAMPDALYTGATFATSSVTTVASDGAGDLALVYSGSTEVGASGHVWVRRSTDSGATWGAATELTNSAGGADATSVAAAGAGTSGFRVTWMDKRTGAWNVWERESTNGGSSWTADAKVSDATSGAPYKTAAGFGLPYGDYDTVAVNSAGKTIAVMGEGDTSQLHGDIWVNRQL